MTAAAPRRRSGDALGPARTARWWRDIPQAAWWALAAAGLGWLFEVFDLYIVALTTPVLIKVFGLTRAQAGAIASASAGGAIVGGIFFGWVSDRIGRVKTLYWCVLIYSLFTGAIVLGDSYRMLLGLRFLGGLGMGEAWAAGAALVAETWPAEHRGKGGALMQMGLPLGAMAAIGAVAAVSALRGPLEAGGWRWIYLLGALPAVMLIFVLKRTPESASWLSGRQAGEPMGDVRGLLNRTAAGGLALAFSFIFMMQYIYWAVFSWSPTYLSTVKRQDFVHSLGFTLVQQLGSLAGFILFAGLVDRLGRRPTFGLFLLCGGFAAPLFILGTGATQLTLGNFFVGLGVGGIFSGMGPFTAELLGATRSRGLGMALAYNGGRLGGLIAPILIGSLAINDAGFIGGMMTTAFAFVVALGVIWLSPETKGLTLTTPRGKA